MTIEMVSVLSYIRKNPGSSTEQIAKTLNLTIKDVDLSVKGLLLKQLITLDAKKRCEPVMQTA